jgi:hypothetical protein
MTDTPTPALTADDYREDGIRGYHQRCRDKWGERAPDYCADCFLLSRLALARHVRETDCEGLREAARYMLDLVDEYYGTDHEPDPANLNDAAAYEAEAEFRRHRAVILASPEAPRVVPDAQVALDALERERRLREAAQELVRVWWTSGLTRHALSVAVGRLEAALASPDQEASHDPR